MKRGKYDFKWNDKIPEKILLKDIVLLQYNPRNYQCNLNIKKRKMLAAGVTIDQILNLEINRSK